MKVTAFLFLTVLISCSQKKQLNQEESILKILPEMFILTTDTALHNINGTWFYKSQKANGYIIEKKNNVLTGKLPIVDGKENGIAYGWFQTGEKRYERSFKNGNNISKYANNSFS